MELRCMFEDADNKDLSQNAMEESFSGVLSSNVLSLNKQAMESMNRGNLEKCITLLKSAEKLLNSHKDVDYKYCKEVEENEAQGSYIEYDQGEGKSQEKKNKLINKNQPDKALEYLNKALEIEVKRKDNKQSASNEFLVESTEHAGTFLNVCAILSQKGQHKEALKMAKKAVTVLKEVNINKERKLNGTPRTQKDDLPDTLDIDDKIQEDK